MLKGGPNTDGWRNFGTESGDIVDIEAVTLKAVSGTPYASNAAGILSNVPMLILWACLMRVLSSCDGLYRLDQGIKSSHSSST